MLKSGMLSVDVRDEYRGLVDLSCETWPGFLMDGLAPGLRIDGEDLTPDACRARREKGILTLDYSFPSHAGLTLCFEPLGDTGMRLRATLVNKSPGEAVLNDVILLGAAPAGPAVSFGTHPDAVRIMEQGNYWGRVRPLAPEKSGEDPGEAPAKTGTASDLVWVAYDRRAHAAFLVGFLTSERWLGRIEMETHETGAVSHWRLGFDGADVLLKPHQEILLEEAVFMAGPDPWRLLETYADVVRDLHSPEIPDMPPVSWCSWYPYRLGVSEDRILENARIAAERLKPLGLRIMEVDLGWEKGHLPCAFEENDRFSHGLKWLSEELGKLGFDLGAWKAPYSISEHDPLAREHPEWLIQGENGEPVSQGEWYWAPHGRVFILDLTHPGARQWLKDRIRSLAERGVRYFKADFIGCVASPAAKNRHDRTIAAGGGTEAARLGARIIREALPEALLLNCGGPEMPGAGQWPLLYACNDTGNTGFLSHVFQKENYLSLACHLFKNNRWGVIQSSCLCVGLPGPLEEARLRATAAFLSGGQVDISDTLTTLPEDRWDVLTATLPPIGVTAKPVDLFDPVYGPTDFDYGATCREEDGKDGGGLEHPPGSVWHLHLKTDWDEWDLVGVFSFDASGAAEEPQLNRFLIPLSMLGLETGTPLWGYEFWSRQFLGALPGRRTNAAGYTHPGDFQDLASGDDPDHIDIAFFGPGVKLLCLRATRPYPWVLGASFHQSCGIELRDVRWDEATLTLGGEIHRPVGESGRIIITDTGKRIRFCEVDGQPVPLKRGANGSWCIPVVMRHDTADWRVVFY